MTNFEKFVSIFGFAPNTGSCITDEPCCLCPICNEDIGCSTEHKENWWRSDFKENQE